MSRRYLVLALLVLWPAAGSPQSGVLLSGVQVNRPTDDPDAPVAAFDASYTNTFAPAGVYFDGRLTSHPDLSTEWERWGRITYAWDFGDPGAGTWSTGARAGSSTLHSKNYDTGGAAIHVFETAGTYNVNMTASFVKNGAAHTDAASPVTITVTSADAYFPGTQTVCIAANTTPVQGVGGCPSGAAVINATTNYGSADFDQSLNVGCNADAGTTDKRCLFKRGDTFSSSVAFAWTTGADVLIGAYGSGADPIVTTSGTIFDVPDTNANRIVIMDLDLDGLGAVGTNVMTDIGPDILENFLMLRVDGTRFQGAFDIGCGSCDGDSESTIHNHVIFADSSFTEDTAANGSNTLYIGAVKSGIVGGTWGLKDGDEHVLRMRYSNGNVMAHAYWGGGCGQIGSSGRHVWKLHNSIWDVTTTPAGRIHAADNLIEGCPPPQSLMIDAGPHGSPSAADDAQEIMEGFVFERNIHNHGSNTGGMKHARFAMRGVFVRNNVCIVSGAVTGTERCYESGARVPNQVTPPEYHWYEYNTFYRSSGSSGSSVGINLTNAQSTTPDHITVRSNLAYDPGSGIDLFNNVGSTNLTLCADLSETACNKDVTSTPFATATPSAFEDWQPAGGSAALNVGELSAGSTLNFTGTNLDDTVPDAGAWQTE